MKPLCLLQLSDLHLGADGATDAEYQQACDSLAPLSAPLYVLPGNHDERGALRRHFAIPGSDNETVQYTADIGPLRLIALDSRIPGQPCAPTGHRRARRPNGHGDPQHVHAGPARFRQAAGIQFESGPAGFALHVLLDGQFVSHVEYARVSSNR